MGANSSSAKGTHLLKIRSRPTIISIAPTTGNTYPVAPREAIKSAAFAGKSGVGKMSINLLKPNRIKPRPRRIFKILENVEFIFVGDWLVSDATKDTKK